MGFLTQFALSLELTKVAPIVITVAAVSYKAAMKLARELQSSGSDLVVEEDLAGIFGRMKVEDSLADEFRRQVAVPSTTSKLVATISLFTGPGPTVLRALTEPLYFSTVVQCSFLVHVHEKASLAAALQRYFHNVQANSLSDPEQRSAPSSNAIRGMLEACEEQTSSFHWMSLLQSAATAMHLPGPFIHESIPDPVFQGLLTMLPFVQRLPEDRMIAIECEAGICSIVVWAHLVLGLCVLVRSSSTASGPQEFRFGVGTEQIVIGYHRTKELPLNPLLHKDELRRERSSITLLESDTKQSVFTLKADTETEFLEGNWVGPVRGYGRRIFEGHLWKPRQQPIVKEMALITCAFALTLSKKLSKSSKGRKTEFTESLEGYAGANSIGEYFEELKGHDPEVELVIPQGRIIDAAKMLFEGVSLDKASDLKTIEEYEVLYTDVGLLDQSAAPKKVTILLAESTGTEITGRNRVVNSQRTGSGSNPDQAEDWRSLRAISARLCGLILALTHVSNMNKIAEMPICESEYLLATSELLESMRAWDGMQRLSVSYSVFLDILALISVGGVNIKIDLKGLCLLSTRGWSIYVSTMGNLAPEHTKAGHVAVKQGVPWRDNVCKHMIHDGPFPGGDNVFWHIEAAAGSKINLKSACPVAIREPLVGETENAFTISLRTDLEHPRQGLTQIESTLNRHGYHELWEALWMVQTVASCSHRPSLNLIVLEPGCMAVSGFGSQEELSNGLSPLTICLTAGDNLARWRTLTGWLRHSDFYAVQLLLRRDDCCLQCAVDKGLSLAGNCILIL